jgi:hypothetical protein
VTWSGPVTHVIWKVYVKLSNPADAKQNFELSGFEFNGCTVQNALKNLAVHPNILSSVPKWHSIFQQVTKQINVIMTYTSSFSSFIIFCENLGGKD